MKTIVNAAEKRGQIEINGDKVRMLTSLPSIDPASCPSLEALVSQMSVRSAKQTLAGDEATLSAANSALGGDEAQATNPYSTFTHSRLRAA